ncbi:hypothetical protein [Devosia sp.]|uniref:hypothetical protein n=1 Tax=Devosia sp. TaxID=1871048 RepID=UPI002732DFE0|nr:hypothetical protein [Devosia sp.]MDP2779609.1 hypothetical protein [Devosia sp.]
MADKKNKGGIGAAIVMFAVLGAMAVWTLISPEFLMNSLQAERAFAVQMGGVASDRWIYTQSISASMDIIKDSTSAIKETEVLPAMMKNWSQERAIVTWLWYSLITYRANMLLLYFFILFPFVIAITLDGWGVREISMHRFSSQSPIKHRMGVVISNTTLIGVAIWIALPFPIPAVVAPLAIIAIGFSSWVWLSNLQKRI